MPTRFRLIPKDLPKPDVDQASFARILPASMSLDVQGDEWYIVVNSSSDEDLTAQYHINRELDRLFFFTGVRLEAEMCRRTISATLTSYIRVHGKIPASLSTQEWTYDLGVQLHLWRLANETEDPILKVIFYFQIIEISYPDKSSYPEYRDPSAEPHSLTECKFVRHLVAHAGDVGQTQLKLYCSHLGLPEVMLDPTDPHYFHIILSKIKLLRDEAERAILRSI